MSATRFAPITAALLAVKGEARPWGAPDAVTPAFSRDALSSTVPLSAPLSTVPPPVAAPVMTPRMAAHHRCTIRMSAHDFQRLGIVAVKDGTTRQHLLQQALADFLAAKEREYRAQCRCMAAAPCGACDLA